MPDPSFRRDDTSRGGEVPPSARNCLVVKYAILSTRLHLRKARFLADAWSDAGESAQNDLGESARNDASEQVQHDGSEEVYQDGSEEVHQDDN